MKKVVLFMYEDSEYRMYDELHINGKLRKRVGSLSDCPEDACIGRDLVSCGDIMDYMQEVYADVITNNQEYKFIVLEQDPNNLSKEEYDKIWEE